jgi:hypothetical protein
MQALESMAIGVVLERRKIDNPWQDHVWNAVAVLPGAAEIDAWRDLGSGEGWARFHAATLPLELHRSDTEAYRVNLSDEPPRIYVLLRDGDDEDDERDAPELSPFLVTASAFEAQDYMDSGEEVVEGVPMPDAVIAWVQTFIDKYHVDEPFKKRKRHRLDPNKVGFGRPAPGSAGRDD